MHLLVSRKVNVISLRYTLLFHLTLFRTIGSQLSNQGTNWIIMTTMNSISTMNYVAFKCDFFTIRPTRHHFGHSLYISTHTLICMYNGFCWLNKAIMLILQELPPHSTHISFCRVFILVHIDHVTWYLQTKGFCQVVDGERSREVLPITERMAI